MTWRRTGRVSSETEMDNLPVNLNSQNTSQDGIQVQSNMSSDRDIVDEPFRPSQTALLPTHQSHQDTRKSIWNHPFLLNLKNKAIKARSFLGSRNPIQYDYEPGYSFLQKPVIFFEKLIPNSYRFLILFIYHVIILVSVILVTKFSQYSAQVQGFDSVSTGKCYSSFFTSCGLNGVECLPYSQKIAIRCPAGCSGQKAWTPKYVGKTAIQYTQFVIGSDLYRADSWICTGAVHAGLISDATGGCVIAEMIPNQNETYDRSTTRNGITSIPFNSTFPASLKLSKPSSSSYCSDLGYPSLGFFIPWLFLLAFLYPSRRHYAWSIFIWIYLYWVFISPDTSKSDAGLNDSLSVIIPYVAVLYCYDYYVFRRSMPSPRHFPFELSILWLGGLWTGIHIDIISNSLPPMPSLSFNANMLRNPGSIGLVVAIFVILILILVYACHHHWKQDTLFPYLVGYACLGIVYALLPRMIGLVVHLHHYLLSLILLPLSSLRTRFSLLCQGLLIGLFAQGVIKWGFASPFDTQMEANKRYIFSSTQTQWNTTSTDLQGNSILKWYYPVNETMNITDLYSATLQDQLGPQPFEQVGSITEYSLMMNDVEIYRGRRASFQIPLTLGSESRQRNGSDLPFDTTRDVPLYFRVAPVVAGSPLDYGQVAMISLKNQSVYLFDAFQN